MKKTTVHNRILDYMRELIDRAKAGDALPSIRTIQKHFTCSHATIDKALAELEQQGFIDRQPGRGVFVASPEKRVLAERARASRNGSILFAYPDYISYEYAMTVQQAESQAIRRGLNLVNLKMKVDTSYDYLFERLAKAEDVSGVLILPSGLVFEKSIHERLAAMRVPAVVLWPREHGSARSGIRHVCGDHYASGRMMLTHLIDRGRDRIAYIHNEPTSISSTLRYKGIKQGLYDRGRKLKDLIRTSHTTAPWADSSRTAYLATRELASQSHRPAAYIYDSANGALAGLRALFELGLSVPRDAAVIAEGGSDFNEYLFPRITTTECDIAETVETAFRLLVDEFDSGTTKKQDFLLPFRYHVRETT